MSNPQYLAADAKDIADTIAAVNRTVSADTLKIIEDTRAMETRRRLQIH